MGSIINPTIDNFLRTRKQKHRDGRFSSVKRTIFALEKQVVFKFNNGYDNGKSSLIKNTPLSANKKNINLKTKIFLEKKTSRLGSPLNIEIPQTSQIEEKVGLVSSRSRLGRVAQGIGSLVTPGNISPLRSPIRSGLYRAITPGLPSAGMLRRAVTGTERGYRCPAGFEFGGRFTDNEYTTCGAQLFEIPGPLALIARAVRRANNIPSARVESLSQVIEGQPSANRTVQIQRMAKIPRNAAPNRPAFNKAVDDAITVLKGAPSGEGRMIRKDGIILRPLVPSSVLRQFSGNKDMLDGAMIRAAQTPQDISSDDLGLLAGPSMSRISYIAPNGALISIERVRPLTVGERRKFGRQLNRAISTDPNDPTMNIQKFAESTKGAFKYSEKYGNVPEPLELVTYTGEDGVERTVRRWVYEAFIKKSLSKTKIKPNE